FYPLISNMPMYRGLPSALCHNLRNANSLSSKVLCLPIYSELTIEECDKIINLIKKVNER
ncbi:TPA: DegT/DnrJ/EryC1/StrS family aminotransferase, partial [Escherichia coli]